MKLKSPLDALATFLNMDYYDVKDMEYQPGHHKPRVFAFEDGYYCSSKTLIKPNDRFVWVEIPDLFINQSGFKIYFAKI